MSQNGQTFTSLMTSPTKKRNAKPRTFFIADSKTCRVFWWLEQLSRAIGQGLYVVAKTHEICLSLGWFQSTIYSYTGIQRVNSCCIRSPRQLVAWFKVGAVCIVTWSSLKLQLNLSLFNLLCMSTEADDECRCSFNIDKECRMNMFLICVSGLVMWNWEILVSQKK